jgi:alpha-galactosidase
MRPTARRCLVLAGAGTLALMLTVPSSFTASGLAAASDHQAESRAAATFTGKWVAQTTFGGTTRETTYFLVQRENTLTGAILNGYRMQDIADGIVNGNQATWATVIGTGDQQRRVEYSATLDGDQLTVTMTGGGGFGGRAGAGTGAGAAIAGGPPAGAAPAAGRGRGGPMVAKRMSNDGTPVGPFDNLPKEVLPAIHNVSDGGLARTPPMGWNSWYHFRAAIDDAAVRAIADAVVSSGMKDAGYTYINIDDTWEGSRDANGNLGSNSRFPDMKALADYIHSKGLLFGLYSSPGPRTCGGYEGSYGHEAQDAKTWASWGVDFLKYDWCSASAMFKPEEEHAVYQEMGDALRATGRPIAFSLCQYGQVDVQTWGPKVGGNMWRTTGDNGDNWQVMSRAGFDEQVGLEKFSGPGHWNDPDMLQVGNGGMTDVEYQTQMSLWSMLAAPLLAGNDPRDMTQASHDTLTNREVIAIDQDKAGRQGYRVAKNGDNEVWVRPLANGDLAVSLFNRGGSAATITAAWSDLKLSGEHKVRDLWQHKDLGPMKGSFSAEVPSHGVVLIRVSH